MLKPYRFGSYRWCWSDLAHFAYRNRRHHVVRVRSTRRLLQNGLQTSLGRLRWWAHTFLTLFLNFNMLIRIKQLAPLLHTRMNHWIFFFLFQNNIPNYLRVQRVKNVKSRINNLKIKLVIITILFVWNFKNYELQKYLLQPWF